MKHRSNTDHLPGIRVPSVFHPWLLILTMFGFALAAAEPQVDSSQLPRIPPTEPTNALATFRVKPGFRIELAAAEPDVVDPIALSFDEDGRLYVVEMRDYSERRPERLGRIRLLEDTDGDGRYEKSTVFAKDLPWPTAVFCWDGGVFVGATPDILYFKDTNGDGVADVREVIFTGFASDYAPFETNKLNVQALMNSFNWSLDNRIHGATSFSGGKVKLVDSPFVREWLRSAASSPSPGGEGRREGEPNPPHSTNSPAQPSTLNAPLDLRGRDFSFDPRTLEMRAESGGGQHGLSFDNRGRKYVCSNSSHIQTLMYEERYAARNPYYNMPRALVDIAVDGGAAPVFRISPDEPWRVIRTQWRVAGLVPGPIEGGGRPSGYFTGATGIIIYRGDALGEDFVGDAFVGDAGSNLVHRKKIYPDGVGVRAERPADEQNVEFLASTDNWFRPVQLANGPDGALYICDMYREVIEHPWSLPDSIKKHLDLNSGNDRGRIYRVVPTNFTRPKPPQLSKATTVELVKALESLNGWTRDTAARLIYERQDKSAVPELEKLFSEPWRWHYARRIHALYALAGLHSLKEEHLLGGDSWFPMLGDRWAAVRENALKFAEQYFNPPSNELWEFMRSGARARLLPDREPPSDLQLALTIGEMRHPARLDALWDFIEKRSSPYSPPKARLEQNGPRSWCEAAVLNALRGDAFAMFCRATNSWRSGLDFEDRAAFLGALARVIGAQNNSNEVATVLTFAAEVAVGQTSLHTFSPLPVVGSEIIIGLDEGLRRIGSSLQAIGATPSLKRLYAVVEGVVTSFSDSRSERQRVTAIKALATAPYVEYRLHLRRIFIDGQASATVQEVALAAMTKYADTNVAPDVLFVWAALTPTLRAVALAALLQRTERIEALLSEIELGVVRPAELSASQLNYLRNHRNERIRTRATEVLGKTSSTPRTEVVVSFQPALTLLGDAMRGRKTFTERCASCHKLGNEGHALGPDLATVKSAGKEKLLTNILDPNREVAPNFLAYSIDTKDGDSFTGVVMNESASSVTLRQANGIETVIARQNISSMQSQGKSLMPEGLEAGLSAQDMADLLEFIINPPLNK